MKKVFTFAVFSLFFVSLFAQSSSLEACEISKDRIICSVGGNYAGKIIDETPDNVVILDRRGKKHFVPKVFIRRQKEICMDKKGRNGKRFSHALSAGFNAGVKEKEFYDLRCGVGSTFIHEIYLKPRFSLQHQVALSLQRGFDVQVGLGLMEYTQYAPYVSSYNLNNQSLYTLPFLLGLQKNFRTKTRLTPYINTNIGKSIANIHQMSGTLIGDSRYDVQVKKGYLYQANVGCEFQIMKKRAVFVEFGYWRQYLNFVGRLIPLSGSPSQNEDLKIYSDLNMKVGYRF